MGIADRGRAVLAAILISAPAWGGGCISPAAVNPPVVNTTPLGVAMRSAKPPDCPMPVLDSMPIANHQQVALVDAWGDLAAKDDDLLAKIKSQACQVGADAVVLTSQQTQHEGDLRIGVAPGRYGNTGPGSDEPTEQGAHIGIDPEGVGKTHHAVVGEPGHPGRFMGGVAIVYTKGGAAAGTASNGNP